MTDDGTPAVVARRADDRPVETGEIRALADAAGYDVRGEVTQARAEDPGTHFGQGKVTELADVAAATGAHTVVVDGGLTPAQNHQLQSAMPDGARVFDRYRLVLEIFGEQAETRRGQLQVELAQLRYDLPRMREAADEQWFNRSVEKGSPLYDVEDRIDRLEAKLAELPAPAEQFRERRREEGFDLVTLAGYTNAGKSTLLRRLADDLRLDADGHADETASATVADRLFETLETTTRRATLDGRPVLVTDTVGFVSDLPHWLVASFGETLSEAAAADAVVLVADASDPLPEFREKLQVGFDVLDAQQVDRDAVVLALNKVDRLDADERERRVEAATDAGAAGAEADDAAAATGTADPVPVSATGGTNLDALVAAIADQLPTARATVTMPNCDDAMAVVSRAYDRATVADVRYDAGTVELAVSGRPAVVAQLESRAADVRTQRSK